MEPDALDEAEGGIVGTALAGMDQVAVIVSECILQRGIANYASLIKNQASPAETAQQTVCVRGKKQRASLGYKSIQPLLRCLHKALITGADALIQRQAIMGDARQHGEQQSSHHTLTITLDW